MMKELKQQLNARNATLVAVSKTQPLDRILDLYEQGQRAFGENRALEMRDKHELLPKDIEWHMIGHVQTNKVKYFAPFVGLVHSIDSFELLQEVDKQASRCDRVIDCLLQFHIAAETTKFGFLESEALNMLNSPEFRALAHIRICGVMGMATFTDDQQQVRREFKHLKAIFNHLQAAYFSDKPYFKEISMGMSGDWQIAVEEGSTIVRIGTLLFGSRPT